MANQNFVKTAGFHSAGHKCYKAVKDYIQKQEEDYEKTFAPVVMYSSIHLLLVLQAERHDC